MKKQTRKGPYRSKRLLTWAKMRGGPCCLCGVDAQELHHFGSRGVGQKCSDLDIAPVCMKCHREIHGALRLCGPEKVTGYTAIFKSNLELLKGYIEHIEGLLDDYDELTDKF